MTAPDRGEADVRAGVVTRLRAAGCVFAEDEAALILAQSDDPAERERLVDARAGGVPLEHVLGWADFAGQRVIVEPGVFVPRRRTELMVAQAVTLGDALDRVPLVVLDLCCGSGAVAAVVAHRLEVAGRTVELVAADLDPAAVRCARRNLPATARVVRSDLFSDLPADLRGRVDVLCANVPYVPTAAIALMPREARDHEARLALDGGDDGLAVLRRLLADAETWLTPGGVLLVEVGVDQRTEAEAAMRRSGLTAWTVRDPDLAATVLIGRKLDQAGVDPED